jgi:hypothetical protein
MALMTLAATPGFSQGTNLPPAPGSATAPGTPANLSPGAAQVVRLAKAGVGDDVLAAYIRSTQTPFNLSADDVLYLRNSGLSAAILSTMLNHDGSLRTQQHAYVYSQHLYGPGGQFTPPTAPAAPTAAPAPVAPPAPTATPTPPAPVVVEQPPPVTPQVEVIPASPGPAYYWTPGYWAWRRHVWVWVGGAWVIRPRPAAIWVGGHWDRRDRGWVWVEGGWR